MLLASPRKPTTLLSTSICRPRSGRVDVEPQAAGRFVLQHLGLEGRLDGRHDLRRHRDRGHARLARSGARNSAWRGSAARCRCSGTSRVLWLDQRLPTATACSGSSAVISPCPATAALTKFCFRPKSLPARRSSPGPRAPRSLGPRPRNRGARKDRCGCCSGPRRGR